MDDLIGNARSLWTVWMFGLFVAIVAWAFWPKNRKRLEAHASIPLKND